MADTLLVPIHLECLYLPHADVVVEAMANFGRLPFARKARDINPDIANVTEDILSQPFENKNLLLKPGVHLHWALPDALTRGEQCRAKAKVVLENGSVKSIAVVDGGAGYAEPPAVTIFGNGSAPAKAVARLKGDAVHEVSVTAPGSGFTEPPGIVIAASQTMEFPAVPNRWLVSRTYSGTGNPEFAPERKWIVESDYLYPADTSTCGSVIYPLEAKRGEPPFRYLGRQLPLEAWLDPDPSSDYLDRLTAVGYGESAFAAFYPNCHSVFGFHDSSVAGASRSDLSRFRYDVVGWFSGPDQDPLQSLASELEHADERAKIDAIESRFKWRVGIDPSAIAPDRIACYARVTLAPDRHASFGARAAVGKEANARVAIANTGTEALSALLAETIDRDNKADFEDQLEALHLGGRLDGMQLDVGAKFKEARHEKGFQALSGGLRWSIQPNSPPGQRADARTGDLFDQVTLPEPLGEALNALNGLQQAYDRALEDLESSQSQLYADWYKYLLCAYPPEEARDDYIDIDEVKFFIQTRDLPDVAARRITAGKLRVWMKDDGSVAGASNVEGDDSSLAAQVAARVAQIAGQVDAHNDTLSLARIGDIADWGQLLSVLREPPDAAAAARLQQRLDEHAKNLIAQISQKKGPDADQKAGLIEIINRLIDDPSLYRQQDFDDVKLPDEVNALLREPGSVRSKRGLRRLNRLLIEAALPGIIHPGPRNSWTLRTMAASRFWQPRPPVILMTGSALEATKRHGSDGRLRADGLLQCHLADTGSPARWDGEALAQLLGRLDAIQEEQGGEHIGHTKWTSSSWHPFLLEWEVEVFSLRDGCNHTEDDQIYRTDFITRNLSMEENSQDLAIRPGQHKVVGAANLYSGRTVLTPSAEVQLKGEIEAFLKHRMLSDYAAFLQQKAAAARPPDQQLQRMLLKKWNNKWKAPADDDVGQEFSRHIAKLIPWYGEQPWRSSSAAVANIITAYRYLQSETFYSLSQALGGFDDALLMHRQVLQLPIADPLAFDDYAAFAETVRDAVGSSTRRAPQPASSFNPIRSGHMKILRLRLIDTFGRTIDVVKDGARNPITPDFMKVPWDPDAVYLPPRLVQPARLNFRWLSARHDEQEMNDHPATTPICGWILPNNLDGSLMVFDVEGTALGYIDQETRWRPTPGGDGLTVAPERPVPEAVVQNGQLRRVVNRIRGHGQAFLGEFITTLDAALENIDPEGFAQHQALALLIGRPIAVVRASLALEIQGLVAQDQGWRSFRGRLGGSPDQTAGYPRVRFPVRIGEYRQLNDGLVGYWNEWNDERDEIFHVSDANKNARLESGHIVRIGDSPTNIDLSLSAPPHNLTMLVDPRGKVHASMGILPTKAIDIPADQYADALAAINVTFFSAPILTDVDKLRLPLPAEPGFAWSWIEKRAQNWTEIPRKDIAPPVTQATLAVRQAIREGWLKLSRSAETTED